MAGSAARPQAPHAARLARQAAAGGAGARHWWWPKPWTTSARNDRTGRWRGKPWMARRRAQRVQELNNVLQEQHAKEAHGCAGGRLHITQIGRARSAEQQTALPALPHRSLRMSASDPAALAATAAAPNLWRYVERPPIAPRAATTGVMRSLDCRGDAGMGEASASRSALFPPGWPKGLDGVGCNAVQPRRAGHNSGLAEVSDRCRLQRRRR